VCPIKLLLLLVTVPHIAAAAQAKQRIPWAALVLVVAAAAIMIRITWPDE
jgi:hypothetical protein